METFLNDFLELLGDSAVLNAHLQLLNQLMEEKITSGKFFSKFYQKSIDTSHNETDVRCLSR